MKDLARQVVTGLQQAGQSIATAESLTGGLLCAALVDVPGASAVVRGGVVAYAADVKTGLLGVDAQIVAARGTVDPLVAKLMARAVCARVGADWGVSTTGVAGPDPSEGKPVGTVHVAVAGPDGVTVHDLAVTGSRAEIRERTVASALSFVVARLGEHTHPSIG